MDITDRKCLKEDRREADRGKDEFLAMLGHELRIPLTPSVPFKLAEKHR